jgi:hypothetical protein
VKALTTQQGPRRFQVTQAYFHDREDNYEYRKQLPAPLNLGEATNLRLLIGQNISPDTAYLRLGLNGANQAYGDVSMTVLINGRIFHAGPTAPYLVVTTGTRHGIAPCPATEAYVQWPVTDAAMLREGWNDIAVTLLPTSQKNPLQLVETEIAITQP